MAMHVSDILTVDAIVVRPQWTSFDDAVGGLVDRLVAARFL